jgi:hypothetical protein
LLFCCPFVIKPATGAGALRTNIIRSPEEYARALKLFSGQSDVEIVAESFIDAPEVYIDGIWKNGDLRWSSISRNHNSPLSAVQGGVLRKNRGRLSASAPSVPQRISSATCRRRAEGVRVADDGR